MEKFPCRHQAYNIFLDVYRKPSQLRLNMMPPKIPINVYSKAGTGKVAYGYSYKPHKAVSPAALLWQSS